MENDSEHRTYLVTFSQLGYKKFPTRWSSGGAVVALFSVNNVDYFVAAKENYKTSSTGYQCAGKLQRATSLKITEPL